MVAGSVMLSVIVLSAQLLIMPALGNEGEQSDAAKNLRTQISDVPWDPTALLDEDKIIYGDDDRKDIYEVNNPERRKWAAATCALVFASDLTDNGNGTYNLATYAYEIINPDNGQSYPPCTGERFANQPAVAFCSGFKVDKDIITTAGHCISEFELPSVRFVFGFDMTSATTPVLTFNADQIYMGTDIIGRGDPYVSDYDYAVVRVDREITVAESLPLRKEGTIELGTKIGVIGHPSGLPKKSAFGENTTVYDNSYKIYFYANLDACGGNSGSPVFNTTTGDVEGILVHGPYDSFEFEANCFRSLVVPNATWPWVGVTKSTIFARWVYAPNDICEYAKGVFVGIPEKGSTEDATGTDRTSCCENDNVDLWYFFRPPQNSHYTVSLCGSDFDASLAVFIGGCNSLQEIACNDDSIFCGYASQLCLWMEQYYIYYIRVAGFQGATGNFEINITEEKLCECEKIDVAFEAVSDPAIPLVVHFTNTSTGTAENSCYWDFGDGNFSDDWLPTHIYESPGSYLVSLNVTNYCGETVPYQDTICIYPEPVFDTSPLEGPAPLTVNFSVNDIPDNSFSWDFGDGTTSSVGTTTHTYEKPGKYRVSLIKTNICGDKTYEKVITVGEKPYVYFEALPIENGLAVNFINYSVFTYGGCSEILWDFGDNKEVEVEGEMEGEWDESSCVANAMHVYEDPDTYEVCLTLRNEYGESSFCQIVTVGSGALANDACYTAEEVFLSTDGESFCWNSIGAGGKDISSCGADDFNDVWFTFTAPCTAIYDINTVGSSFNTTVAVYEGACHVLVELACNDDVIVAQEGEVKDSAEESAKADGSDAEDCEICGRVHVPLTGGETYWIRGAGVEGAAGDYCLTIRCLNPADKNYDWRVSMNEAISYLVGWRQGKNPMDYAIRAMYLWQGGNAYRYEPGTACPLGWIVENK